MAEGLTTTTSLKEGVPAHIREMNKQAMNRFFSSHKTYAATQARKKKRFTVESLNWLKEHKYERPGPEEFEAYNEIEAKAMFNEKHKLGQEISRLRIVVDEAQAPAPKQTAKKDG